MAAFVISEVEVLDMIPASQYRKHAEISIKKYGGRYLARAVKPEVVEGEPTNRRIVIIEFPSMQKIHEWYTSPEYTAALKFRDSALDRRLMFIEGLNDQIKTCKQDFKS